MILNKDESKKAKILWSRNASRHDICSFPKPTTTFFMKTLSKIKTINNLNGYLICIFSKVRLTSSWFSVRRIQNQRSCCVRSHNPREESRLCDTVRGAELVSHSRSHQCQQGFGSSKRKRWCFFLLGWLQVSPSIPALEDEVSAKSSGGFSDLWLLFNKAKVTSAPVRCL